VRILHINVNGWMDIPTGFNPYHHLNPQNYSCVFVCAVVDLSPERKIFCFPRLCKSKRDLIEGIPRYVTIDPIYGHTNDDWGKGGGAQENPRLCVQKVLVNCYVKVRDTKNLHFKGQSRGLYSQQ
jgi:hypothetical protein